MYKNSLAFITLGTALSLLCIYIIIDYYSKPIEYTESLTEIQSIKYNNDEPLLPIMTEKPKQNEKIFISEVFNPTFEIRDIDDALFEKMKDRSFHNRGHVKRDDLKLVLLGYYNFMNEPMQGEIIVHHLIADEVIEIFKELYEHHYPIDQISLIHKYEGNDYLSMADNNTHSFNDRLMTGGRKLSHHAYGLAIDINPIQNPYIYNDLILPEAGNKYMSRTDLLPGMIVKGDVCYEAFTSRGWQWGGDWTSPKDYQHFEKILPSIND
jgi:hypothetical protein